MPAYDYRCQECGAVFEVRRSMSEYAVAPAPPCPACASPEVERAYTAVSVLTGGRGDSGGSCGSGGFT